MTLVNAVLQGNWSRAETTFWRFFVNTTLGGLGTLDPASDLGLPQYEEDFGQTLAVAGAEEGGYLFLPLLGPVPPRDLVGRLVDFAFDPLTYIEGAGALSAGRTGAGALEFRAQNLETIDQLRETSTDFYAAVRSAYRQRRNAAILNGQTDVESLPDISWDTRLERVQAN